MAKKFSVSLGLPKVPLVQDPEQYTELSRVYGALDNVAEALDKYTGAQSETDTTVWGQLGASRLYDGLNAVIYLPAGETISYGQTVGINGAGAVMLAVNPGQLCIGFSAGLETVGIGGIVQVQLRGLLPPYAPATLTPGARYYQSATPGVVGGAGTQVIGFAVSDRLLYLNPQL